MLCTPVKIETTLALHPTFVLVQTLIQHNLWFFSNIPHCLSVIVLDSNMTVLISNSCNPTRELTSAHYVCFLTKVSFVETVEVAHCLHNGKGNKINRRMQTYWCLYLVRFILKTWLRRGKACITHFRLSQVGINYSSMDNTGNLDASQCSLLFNSDSRLTLRIILLEVLGDNNLA